MADTLCVALTGGTGFVGGHVLRHLRDAGHRVRALARNPQDLADSAGDMTVVPGDLFDDGALGKLVESADAVVHLVGIIMEDRHHGQTFERVHTEGTGRLLAAARSAGGVKRWVQMSAIGARPDAVARYHRSKWEAEQAVRDSGLPYTIFRPSIIHGPDGEFMQMVRDFCCKRLPPFIPHFGGGLLGRGGGGRLQPVWVEDVARCFTAAVTNPRALGETYGLGGPDVFTWPDLYRTCHRGFPGARPNKRPLAVPVWFARIAAVLPGAPFNVDQIIMSQEDSVCDVAKVQHDFEFELAPFEPTFAEYAAEV